MLLLLYLIILLILLLQNFSRHIAKRVLTQHIILQKTLFVANQTEVLKLHFITLIPFAVADIKFTILGIPFFEYMQNINTQAFTKPELVVHRPPVLLGLGGTGI